MEFNEITATATAMDAQTYYQAFTWFVVLGINVSMMFFAYWIADIANVMESKTRRTIALSFAVMFGVIAIWRMIAIFIYYQDFHQLLAIPVTAAITWVFITTAGYACHRYMLGVHNRYKVRQTNIQLMDDVQKEIVEPLLRGEPVSQDLVAEHKARSIAFAKTASK